MIDSERLQSLGVEDYMQMPWNCHPTNIENLWMLPAKKSGKNGNSESDHEIPKRSFLMRVGKPGEEIDTGLDSVEALRVSFDNILIDCRSLNSLPTQPCWRTASMEWWWLSRPVNRAAKRFSTPNEQSKGGRQIPRICFEQTPLSGA